MKNSPKTFKRAGVIFAVLLLLWPAITLLRFKLGFDLVYASARGNTQQVQLYLKLGANPNALHLEGDPALFYAVTSGNLSTVQALLQHGANPNYTGPHGPILNRALSIYASKLDNDEELGSSNYKEIIKALIAAGATTSVVVDPTLVTVLSKAQKQT